MSGLRLYCTNKYCTQLHCTALHCNVHYYDAMYFPALNFPALDCTALYHTAMHIHALHFSTLNYTSMHCKLLLCTRASKSCRHADAHLRKFFQNMCKYFTFERESGENCPNFVFLAQSDKVFILKMQSAEVTLSTS